MSAPAEQLDLLRAHVAPLLGGAADFDPLLDLVRGRDADFVLLGEATHGTHEFYRIRAEVSKRLIRECGFTAICVEADWPDAFRVNRYIRGNGNDKDATEALSGFRRFPQWMWRNSDVLDLVGWLRSHNEAMRRANAPETGFYGMDLYSLHASLRAVLAHLKRTDPAAAKLAASRYSCFDRFGEDTQRYGYLAGLGIAESCEREAVLAARQVLAGRAKAVEGKRERDEQFDAEMNAKVVRDAERYYREMFREDVSSWNLRDSHMVDTLFELQRHLSGADGHPRAKIIVWAHNSHLGDARATSMGARGEHNVGQLVRERAGDRAVLVGFTTYNGSVTAASEWDAPAERKRVRDAMPGSWEHLFHQLGVPNFFLPLRDPPLRPALAKPLLERAIGVIYRPQTERQSHMFRADIAGQFDAVMHYDATRAVEPLETTGEWREGEVEETYPSGL
ncbi:erythromycin esterase [Hyaloraphidium curvatum]|nr:erythromycin esterase [Hyaloraphidium curvatum]